MAKVLSTASLAIFYVDVNTGGACGNDNTFHAGFGVNTTALSEEEEACGSCYQVIFDYKLDRRWCLRRGSVIITATNFCPPDNHGGWCDPPCQHLDISIPAFLRIAGQDNKG
ncbi:RlpA-like protein, double-psi beta-barrel domain [Dillenia turbinata]|uniref:Expansin n=1 Tax=Dillenia turbinata TaxID=194707 RepID=A0AAN8VQM0_9MAGN